MTRLLVNDCLTTIPGTTTFWSDLQEWFAMTFVGGDFSRLDYRVTTRVPWLDGQTPSLIIRNASYFGPLEATKTVPTISLLQDIMPEGPGREMQEMVGATSRAVVFNSQFTHSQYTTPGLDYSYKAKVIPLPVDFDLFVPGNVMGSQQAAALPDNCVLWIGACEGAAGHVKGWDIFTQIVRLNPDMTFVAVLKDRIPDYCPPNLRMYARLSHEELVSVIQACRVGLCTSRSETQHLAGIEMGACGLPMVAPAVGCYWKREDMPGEVVWQSQGEALEQNNPMHYTAELRNVLTKHWDPEVVRAYWRTDFDRPVIRAAWTQLVEEVES